MQQLAQDIEALIIRERRQDDDIAALQESVREMRRLWQAIGKPISGHPSSRRGEFLDLIDSHISDQDLRRVAFELKVDYDDLEGTGKMGKFLSMIQQLKREGREYQLTAWLQKRRPNVIWPLSDTGPL